MGILTDQLRQAATTVAGIGDGSACYTALNDDELLAAQTQVGVTSWDMRGWRSAPASTPLKR